MKITLFHLGHTRDMEPTVVGVGDTSLGRRINEMQRDLRLGFLGHGMNVESDSVVKLFDLHAIFPELKIVEEIGTFEIDGEDRTKDGDFFQLEEVYRRTNNIDNVWAEDEFRNLTESMKGVVEERRSSKHGRGLRSTSMGDFLVVESPVRDEIGGCLVRGEVFLVASMGFIRIGTLLEDGRIVRHKFL